MTIGINGAGAAILTLARAESMVEGVRYGARKGTK